MLQVDTIAAGVWPTMVTPFTEHNEIDYKALEEMIEWYIAHGVDGLFAVCQSSEMFLLTLEERVALAEFVNRTAAGRIGVIASGHISDSLEDQIEELRAIAATGVQAIVLVSNRLASEQEDDEIWMGNAAKLLAAVPDIPFGVYECPYPYKRLLTPEVLSWCASTGRFLFLKDTCCHSQEIAEKLAAVAGRNLKIYNANAATLLESLRAGASGYSGVMGNFHPDLYVWLTKNYIKQPKEADELQHFLGLASVIEAQYYPVNAKYYLQLEGLSIGLHTRVKDGEGLTYSNKLEIEQLYELTRRYRERFSTL